MYKHMTPGRLLPSCPAQEGEAGRRGREEAEGRVDETEGGRAPPGAELGACSVTHSVCLSVCVSAAHPAAPLLWPQAHAQAARVHALLAKQGASLQDNISGLRDENSGHVGRSRPRGGGLAEHSDVHTSRVGLRAWALRVLAVAVPTTECQPGGLLRTEPCLLIKTGVTGTRAQGTPGVAGCEGDPSRR